MPRYDYECGTCHHVFELKQSFDSDPVATCPECSNASQRQFHSVPIVFKGSGWYVNDYGKKGNNASAESKDQKESKDSSDSSESKTESKSESKTESKSEPVATKSGSESTASAKKGD